LIGTISASKRPFSCAAAARDCERRANASWSLRVDPQQFVHPVRGGRLGLDQVQVGEPFERAFGVGLVQPSQASGAFDRHRVVVEPAEESERAGVLVAGGDEPIDGCREAGPESAVVAIELVEAIGHPGQAHGEVRHRPQWTRREPHTGHVDRQREQPAPPHDGLGGVPLAIDPWPADHGGELREGFGLCRCPERHAVRLRQCRHHPSPGDDGGGARGSGQQRSHLLDVVGVVENEEDPSTGEDGPQLRSRLVQVVGDRPVCSTPSRISRHSTSPAVRPRRLT
jgi:hypothetical protein